MTYLVRAVAVLGAVLAVSALSWLLFGPVSVWVVGVDLARMPAVEQAKAVGDAQGRVAAFLSGAVVLCGLYYTARKYFLDRDKQFTDRFSTAVGHLHVNDETARSGGVRALDRIMDDSPRDLNRARETLAGFLRQHTRGGPADGSTTRDDLGAAVATLRTPRQPARRWPLHPLNLRGVRLAGSDLREIQLPSADLTGADLTGALLGGASLSHARFEDATLERIVAQGVDLSHACLRRASLAGADLTEAVLAEADLTGANLAEAVLAGTDLTGTLLVTTNLCGTDLRATAGLTVDQLRLAKADDRTRVPSGVDHPLSPPA